MARVHHRAIRVNFALVEVNAYRPTNVGVNAMFYDWDPVNQEITIDLSCADTGVNPQSKETIEDEIRRLEPRLVDDKEPRLNKVFGVGDHHMSIKSWLGVPNIDNDTVHRARNVEIELITQNKLDEINTFYDKLGYKPTREFIRPVDIGGKRFYEIVNGEIVYG